MDDIVVGNIIGVIDIEIVIGLFGLLIGLVVLWGNIMKGMDVCFKMINDEGGINGCQIKFVMKDDVYDLLRIVFVVREMVQKDEVYVFVGGIGIVFCMFVMEYIVEEDIFWIFFIIGVMYWLMLIKKNIFSVFFYYIDEGVIQVKYVIDSLGSKKIGIIY